jgi:dihydrodipicolinate synthase/N-acetylneuraminate lyase
MPSVQNADSQQMTIKEVAMTLRGVISPELVFFNKNGSVDYANCRNHMEWVLRKGVKGLFVTGTYGSGYLLTHEERAKIYELAVETTENCVGSFVIAHTGCVNVASAVELTKAASDLHVNAVGAISPLLYHYTNDDVKRYYAAILEASRIPVYAYNNPEITGATFTWGLVEELRDIGISGLKDSSVSVNLAALCFDGDPEATETEFQYIPGTAAGWPVFRKIGTDAMIAGMCNYMPELVVALYNASYSDAIQTENIYRVLMAFASKVKFGNSLVSSHICLHARGRNAGYMRAPLYVDYEKSAAEIQGANTAIGEALADLRAVCGTQ